MCVGRSSGLVPELTQAVPAVMRRRVAGARFRDNHSLIQIKAPFRGVQRLSSIWKKARPPFGIYVNYPMKKIGILAFGSLIRDPGEELRPLKIEPPIKTKTPFGVEYGRYSSKTRGGAPTLVPHPKGKPVDAKILVLNASVSVKDATDMLWRRESGEKDKTKSYPAGETPNSVQVRTVRDLEGVEIVLYTDFLDAGKIARPNADDLAMAAIESVAKAKSGKDGITYLAEAIDDGVNTPLTEHYAAAILAKIDSAPLKEALKKFRKRHAV
jgi:hypothetical protein